MRRRGGCSCLECRRVAGETLAVVVGNIAHNLLMRIVTGNAADTRVGSVEALAVG